MAKKVFKETKKAFITCHDKEVGVLDCLNDYFRDKTREKIAFIESCHLAMSRWGRISRKQYDTLRSIWNNLDKNNVDENLESC